jgi:drug/metabolite transporter (DMT)-like permease
LNTAFLAAALALTAAVCWGAGDFTGGLVSRRSGAFRAVLLAYMVGLALVAAIALARGEQLTTPADLAWGALAGLSGMIGIGALYHGFTLGRMGVIAPISAVLATTIPVVFEALTRGLPSTLQLAGFGIALVGIWLLSRPEQQAPLLLESPDGRGATPRPSGDSRSSGVDGAPKGLGMAMIAGLGFAGFFIGLGQVSGSAVFWPLAAGRTAAVAVMLVFALATRRQVAPRRSSPLWLFALAGVLDVSGNLFFLLSVQNGRLDVTAVLASLYPAVTALVAWLTIKEHLTRIQVFGVAAAVLAIVLITV